MIIYFTPQLHLKVKIFSPIYIQKGRESTNLITYLIIVMMRMLFSTPTSLLEPVQIVLAPISTLSQFFLQNICVESISKHNLTVALPELKLSQIVDDSGVIIGNLSIKIN